ncbi:hypothetical protein OIV83_003734 [Microbotryomycetes sp. JL201]|nr:hypothetical protein OIV83_003734 [Microbotryomycetes sp. JL201]
MTIPQTFDGFGLSPEENSPEPVQHEQLYDDDGPDDVRPASGRRGVNPRKGPGAADKRASHNATERARRENLNGRFMTLAEALPSMHKVKRPSKSVIVNKALEFVYEAQVKEQTLVKENEELRREVNQLRSQLGLPPLTQQTSAARPKPRAYTAPRQQSDSLVTSMGSLDTSSTSSPPRLQQNRSPSVSSVPSPPSTIATSEPSPALPMSLGAAGSGMFSSPVYDQSPIDADEMRQQQLAALFPGQAFGTSPLTVQQAQAQAQAQAHAQAMMQAQLGYMNPAFLTAQHQSMLLAAQQALAQQQHHTLQQQFAQQQQQQQQQALSPSQHSLQHAQPPSPVNSVHPAPSPVALSPGDVYAIGSSPIGVSGCGNPAATGQSTNSLLGTWGSFTSSTSDGFTVFA